MCLGLAQQQSTKAIGPTSAVLRAARVHRGAVVRILRDVTEHHMAVLRQDPEVQTQVLSNRMRILNEQLRQQKIRQAEQDARAAQMRAALQANMRSLAFSMFGWMPKLYQWTYTGAGYAK